MAKETEKPNYIYEYYQKIQDGSIIVGRWVHLVYEYIINGLKEKRFFYDPKKAERPIRFIETFGHHHEGELAPNLIKLELWQKAMLSCIFGIVDAEGYRQFKEIVISMGRGNGKTLLASMMALYVYYADADYGKRIYFTATKLDQAKLGFNAFNQAILKEDELSSIVKKRRTDIYCPSTNTSAEALSSNSKSADGLNLSLAICDEFGAWEGQRGLDLYSTLMSGTTKRREPLVISISTANRMNEGVYDNLFTRSTRMLLGDSEEDTLLPFFYCIDDDKKWNDINELQKSNPNLNVSITIDDLLKKIKIAEGSFQEKNEFMIKNANIKQNQSQAWLSSSDVRKASGSHMELEDLRDKYGVVGIDLSQTTDMTSACVVVEKDGILNIVSHYWLPEAKIEEAIQREGVPYDKYIAQGIMSTSGENFVDYEDVFQWCQDLMQKYEIYPLFVGYDRYSSQYLIKSLQALYVCEDVYQGDNLYGTMLELEGLIKDGKVNIGDNAITKMHFLNSAIKYSNERGRGRLVKINPRLHIDGMASLLCAMAVRSKHYIEYEGRLKNEE